MYTTTLAHEDVISDDDQVVYRVKSNYASPGYNPQSDSHRWIRTKSV